MPFSFHFDVEGLAGQVQGIRDGLPPSKQRALTSIGYRLVSLEKQHFHQLTETGSSNGVSWPKPAAATLAHRKTLQRKGLLGNADPEDVGRTTGRLGNSFRFVVKRDRVYLTNTDPKAGYFSAKRPLYPQSMPANWLASSEATVQRNLDQLSKSVFQGTTR